MEVLLVKSKHKKILMGSLVFLLSVSAFGYGYCEDTRFDICCSEPEFVDKEETESDDPTLKNKRTK